MRALITPLLLGAICAGPAIADVWEYGEAECNELWFARNLIMDRAGYCFGSALGKSLFDNGDCSGKDVRLGAEQVRQVKRIQSLEAKIGCKVNTDRRTLDVPQMVALRRLRDMPLPDNGGSACIGWQGAPVPLYDGHGPGARVIGQIDVGDTIDNGFIAEGEWLVVAVAKGGNRDRVIYGWHDTTDIDWRTSCTDQAG